ncbi:MAG: Fic family protein [Candidatus Bruticola sp.]
MDAQLTKYDVFLAVAGRKKAISKEALVKTMWLNDSSLLDEHLNSLLKEQLLRVTPEGYAKGTSSKGQALLELLLLSVAYEYDYNLYLSQPSLDFLKAVYKRSSFTERELEFLPDWRIYLHHLMKDQLVLFLNYDPPSMRLARTLFFDLICTYFDITPKTKFFDTKIDFNKVIVSKQTAKRIKDISNISLGAHFVFDDKHKSHHVGLPKMQRLISYDILPEQEELFDKKSKANFDKAKDQVEQNSVRFKKHMNINIIKEYHKLATADLGISDQYRDFNVEIKANPYFRTADWKKIPKLMDKLMDDYNSILKSSKNIFDAINLASFFYNEFIHIHPFEDGNSRTAFLCLLHIMNLFNCGMSSIPPCFDYSFIQATKGQKKRNDKELADLLKEIYIVILEQDEFQTMTKLAAEW